MRKPITLTALMVGLWPAIGFSQALDSGDTAWMLTSTALVLFMTLPGLALFYAGLVRSRNVLSVVMQCFAIACMVSVIWVVCGYSMAFGDTIGGYVGGLGKAWISGVGMDALRGTYPETVFIMFQLTFAIITPALFVGGIAERMQFSAMLIFVAAWVLLVYFPVAHWVWGGGWLADIGFRDFAGGAVVHVTAGVAALVAGPSRRGHCCAPPLTDPSERNSRTRFLT